MIFAHPGQLLAQEDRVGLSLRLLPEYYYSEIIPGEENILYLEIRNEGSNEITDIRLVSTEPKGWIVYFKPDSIAYLTAGSFQTIDVIVVPPANT